MKKERDLFSEIIEGFEALADQREGNRTLRTHAVTIKPAPKITALGNLSAPTKLARQFYGL